MNFKISNHKIFSYRNSTNLKSFEISNNFNYIVTNKEIHEYKMLTSDFIAFSLEFIPCSAFLIENIFFVSSKTDLYYFQTDLCHLMKLEALTLNFAYKNSLISIGNGNLRIIDLPFLKSPDSIDLLKKSNLEFKKFPLGNGICSAFIIYDNKVFLGFENGLIERILLEESGSTLETNEIIKLNEPIISLAVEGNALFASTLDKIFKICITDENFETGNHSKIKTKEYTEIKCKKILCHGKLLVVQQDKEVLFLDLNLKILATSIFQLEITDIKIKENSLYIGLKCGLLSSYDILSIENMLESNKK